MGTVHGKHRSTINIMILSPRAKAVIDILLKTGSGFVKINEVFLMRRIGVGSPYRKILYWKRGEDSTNPPPPNLRSFAIVPEMIAAIHKGFGIYSSNVTAWYAFDRKYATAGSFSANNNEWTVVSFPEARWVQGFMIAPCFFSSYDESYDHHSAFIEGKFQNGEWVRLAHPSYIRAGGIYLKMATPMFCTAVRVQCMPSRIGMTSMVRICQFFDAIPLVRSGENVLFEVEGVRSWQFSSLFSQPDRPPPRNSHDIPAWLCFYNQWYVHQSNKGLPSTQDQTRFVLRFDTLKTVCGFSVTTYDYPYSAEWVKCLLIEGRQGDADFWETIDEIEFDPSESKTWYFDFPKVYRVSQLRITVQEVSGNAANRLCLPLMQVYGNDDVVPPPPPPPYDPPYSGYDLPVVPSQPNSVAVIEQDGRLFAKAVLNRQNGYGNNPTI